MVPILLLRQRPKPSVYQSQRLFSCLMTLSYSTGSFTIPAHSTTRRNAKRCLQTSPDQRKFDKVPPQWSFNFKTKQNAPSKHKTQPPTVISDSSKSALTSSQRQAPKSLASTTGKWSSYSLPSKETLEQQKKQMDQQEKDIKERLASEANSTNISAQKKKSKRRLKPLKALITLSPNAISHLRALLDQPEPKLIRVGVRNRGCSGLTYDLQYITTPGKFDEVIEQDGVKVVIDSKALFSIVGSEMDWVDDKLSSRFIFKNPNSKGTCGCGESFMV